MLIAYQSNIGAYIYIYFVIGNVVHTRQRVQQARKPAVIEYAVCELRLEELIVMRSLR